MNEEQILKSVKVLHQILKHMITDSGNYNVVN